MAAHRPEKALFETERLQRRVARSVEMEHRWGGRVPNHSMLAKRARSAPFAMEDTSLLEIYSTERHAR